ncbi:microcystin degradation protein MlrC [Siphonobacter sp. SORGH_AS_0500]|uniref:M81 family metallopeptidase n=1 Tax=Siphonobacter sp. SORGH_AS_0500 TaxID=1864824 RepID=UPI000CB5FDE8|nr:M81 family metallopeptidase [Siphonobacter sp. SORGH_AS_0500]PKK37448.1 microcystin degradation protein MlrC [Siphonobacter sp. SORGH_AS_0500]
MKKRVALMGIYHETNTFIDTPTTLDDFQSNFWLVGDRILAEYAGAYHEISGIIEVITAADDMELVPVFYAMATPGGMIDKRTYETILAELWRNMDLCGPMDGCVVVPHGAGVAEGYPDMDGHWLTELRRKLGPKVPITGTLDPHANVSPAIANATDALVAYASNPHIDQRIAGLKAARLLVRILRGEIKPLQKLVQLPLAISIEQQYTSQEPCKCLIATMNQWAGEKGFVSASLLLGFPYADVAEMGSGFLLVADAQDVERTTRDLEDVAHQLTTYVLDRRASFNGEKISIGQVYETLLGLAKPVLLLDMGDNVGGGGPGNSSVLIEYLENKSFSKVFICLADPDAVKTAFMFSIGDLFLVTIRTVQGAWTTKVILRQLSDGIFKEDQPKHGGFVNYNMGNTVVVETLTGNTIMLTSRRTPPYSLGQMTAFGLDPAAFDIIIAKGVNAPIAAYASVCPSIVQIDTPGVTQADMTLFTYRHRRKPMYPFEDVK